MDGLKLFAVPDLQDLENGKLTLPVDIFKAMYKAGLPNLEVVEASNNTNWNVARETLSRSRWPTADMVLTINEILEDIITAALTPQNSPKTFLAGVDTSSVTAILDALDAEADHLLAGFQVDARKKGCSTSNSTI